MGIFTFLSFFTLTRVFSFLSFSLLTIVFNYILGFLGIFLICILFIELLFLARKVIDFILKNKEIKITSQQKKHLINRGILVIFFIIVSFVYGFISFYNIEVTRYTIESDKIKNNYKFLQITDTQYGSLSQKDLDNIAALIKDILKKEKIDFILFTGDAIDTDSFNTNTFDQFDFSIPQFFTLGNHEFYHNLEKILEVIKQRNYQILRNNNVVFKELNIIGIDDANDKKQVIKILNKKPEIIIKNKYNILGYHRPVGALDAKSKGVDLMVTGHTHGGQIFPFTLVLKLIYNYPQGLVDLDNFYLFTSNGVGLWGPRLRIGTKNEITIFNLIPKKSLN